MNAALGNVGQTVVYTDPIEAEPVDQLQSLRDLVADMDAGKVDAARDPRRQPGLHGAGRPAVRGRDEQGPLRVHLSLYDDETSALCHWHVPEAHFLESWSDARAYDGTASIVQPLIAPLYGGDRRTSCSPRSSDRPEQSAYDLVREFWSEAACQRADFETFWRRSVHDGVDRRTRRLPPRSVSVSAAVAVRPAPSAAGSAGTRDLVPERPDDSRRPLRE